MTPSPSAVSARRRQWCALEIDRRSWPQVDTDEHGTFTHAYASFGDLGLGFTWAPLSGAVALNGAAAGLLEELAFRGAILSVLFLSWRGISGGALTSALLTAAERHTSSGSRWDSLRPS